LEYGLRRSGGFDAGVNELAKIVAPAPDSRQTSQICDLAARDLPLEIDELLVQLAKRDAAWSWQGADFFTLCAYSLANHLSLAVAGQERGFHWRSHLAVAEYLARSTMLGLRLELHLPPPPEMCDVIFVSGTHRSDTIGNKRIVQPIDPLRLILQEFGVRSHSLLYAGPPPVDSLLPHYRIRRHRRRGGQHFRNLRRAMADWSGLKEILAFTAETTGLGPAFQPIWLQRLVAITRDVHDAFLAYLPTTRAKAVIVCGGVDSFTAGAVWAARELGYVTFELQHGHLRLFDPRMTGRNGSDALSAEHFLAWTAATPLASGVRHFITGSPARLTAVAARHEMVPPEVARAYQTAADEVARRTGNLRRPIALVTEQPGVHAGAALASAAAQTAEVILWRRHQRSRVSVSPPAIPDAIDASEWPMAPLLENIDVHITYSSASALEAFDFLRPSTILSAHGQRLIRSAVANPSPLHKRSEAECLEEIATAAALCRTG
jgi:hypothetical protein